MEAITGVAFGGIVAAWGLSWASLLLLIFAAFSVVLAGIDLDVQRLPNVIVAPLAMLVALVIIADAITSGTWDDALVALIGAASVGALYGLAWFVYPRGLGLGDVKLAPVLGAVMGWFGAGPLVVGTFAGFLWGAVFGVMVMLITKRARKVRIPFGPWMLLGAWTGIIFGAAVWDWYTTLMFARSG